VSEALVGDARSAASLRYPTARQATEGESLKVQQRQIEGYALMHALTLAGVLVEERRKRIGSGRGAAGRSPLGQ
jgi:hypothetical protein